MGHNFVEYVSIIPEWGFADAIKTHHPAMAQLHDVYTLSGVQVRRQVKSLDGLKKGVYIINGHKVVIK